MYMSDTKNPSIEPDIYIYIFVDYYKYYKQARISWELYNQLRLAGMAGKCEES
uniref:Uncharacterized protein n=1 Tax=Helianthus annuus TaxID=4232 RepID=A0A251UJ47_HELAN